MIELKFLTKANSITIWQQYVKRIDRQLKYLNGEIKEEILLELQNHLYESFRELPGEDEVARLLQAQQNLGEPEQFLQQMVSNRLLRLGSVSKNPKHLLLGILYGMQTNIGNFILLSAFGIGYLFALCIGVLSMVKLAIPNRIGLFVAPNGSWQFGFPKNIEGYNELLGMWMVPSGLVISCLMYFLLTWLLKLVLNRE